MIDDVEQQLRAALAARAAQVTADSLRVTEPMSAQHSRTAGVPGITNRRRRLWTLALRLSAPVGSVAAVLTAVLLALWLPAAPDGTPGDASTTAPRASVSALDGVVITPPADWVYLPMVEGIGCVQPAGTGLTGDTCTPTGIEIRVGTFVGWPQNSLDRADGWSLNPEDCTGSGTPDPGARVTANQLTNQQTRTVDGHTASYRTWKVSCGTASTFTVRLWWVPDASLALYTKGMDSRYDAAVDQLVGNLRLPAPGSR